MKKSSNNTNDVFIKSIKKNVFESIKIKWITSCSSSGMLIPPKALAEFDARINGVTNDNGVGIISKGFSLFRNKSVKEPFKIGNNYQSFLNLSNCNLTDDHIYHLIEALKLHSKNSSISKIDLSNNNITNIGGNIILSLLRSHSLILKSLLKENVSSNIKKYLDIPWLYHVILSSNSVTNDLLYEIEKLTNYFYVTNISSYVINKYLENNSNLTHFDVIKMNSLWSIIINENPDNELSKTFLTKEYQDIELLIINRLLTLGKLSQIKSNEIKSTDFFSYANIIQSMKIENLLPTSNDNNFFKSDLINNNNLLSLNMTSMNLSANNVSNTNNIIPDGWEQKYNDKGRVYYVDHKNRKTSWTLPKEVIPESHIIHKNDDMKMKIIEDNKTKVLKLEMIEKSKSIQIARIEEEDSISSILEQSRLEEESRIEAKHMEEESIAFVIEQSRLEEEARIEAKRIEIEELSVAEIARISEEQKSLDDSDEHNKLEQEGRFEAKSILEELAAVVEQEKLYETARFESIRTEKVKLEIIEEEFIAAVDQSRLDEEKYIAQEFERLKALDAERLVEVKKNTPKHLEKESIEKSRIPLRYRVLYDFITNESNELSVVAGDLVEKFYLNDNLNELENDYENNWILVKPVNILEDSAIVPSLIGYVPSNYMEILNENEICDYTTNLTNCVYNNNYCESNAENKSNLNNIGNKILEEETFNIIEKIKEEDKIEIITIIDSILEEDKVINNNNEIENELPEIFIDDNINLIENLIEDTIEKQKDIIPDIIRNKVDFNVGFSLLSSLPSEENDISNQLFEFDKFKKSCNNEEFKEFMQLIEYKRPISTELDDKFIELQLNLNHLTVDTSMNDLITNHLLNMYKFYDKQLKSRLEVSLSKAWLLLKKFIPNMKEQGPIPASIQPLLDANENQLWALFSNYSNKEIKIPSNLSKCKKFKNKIIDTENLWKLFKDFNICPDICNKLFLKELIFDELIAETNNSLNDSYNNDSSFNNFVSSSPLSPLSSSSNISNNMLSYDNFLKMLCRIAFECIQIDPRSSALSKMIMLLIRMDTSDGRVIMAKKNRICSVVLPFSLSRTKYSIQNQIALSTSTTWQSPVQSFYKSSSSPSRISSLTKSPEKLISPIIKSSKSKSQLNSFKSPISNFKSSKFSTPKKEMNFF